MLRLRLPVGLGEDGSRFYPSCSRHCRDLTDPIEWQGSNCGAHHMYYQLAYNLVLRKNLSTPMPRKRFTDGPGYSRTYRENSMLIRLWRAVQASKGCMSVLTIGRYISWLCGHTRCAHLSLGCGVPSEVTTSGNVNTTSKLKVDPLEKKRKNETKNERKNETRKEF